MKIFFDFDDFFLDTGGAMIRDYFSLLKKLTGAIDKDINDVFERFSGAGFDHGELYSPERNIEFLKENLDFDSEKALAAIRSFFTDIRRYLFEGTEDFLRTLSKDDIYLLTFGEKNFQNMKVDGSRLRDFFHEVIIVGGDKSEEIKRVAKRENFNPDETIVFADNRCGHFAGAKERGIITIHLKRPTDKYSKEPCEGCRHTAENFDELREILDTLH
jgi:FMN phosphatase YigB (HAD superfamily)